MEHSIRFTYWANVVIFDSYVGLPGDIDMWWCIPLQHVDCPWLCDKFPVSRPDYSLLRFRDIMFSHENHGFFIVFSMIAGNFGWSIPCLDPPMFVWWVVWTPLKNMNVNWDYYSQHMGKQNMATKPPTSCWFAQVFGDFSECQGAMLQFLPETHSQPRSSNWGPMVRMP